MYGHVGLGLNGANSELLLESAPATDGGRRVVIAIGDSIIAADDLEASGMLGALGLIVIRPPWLRGRLHDGQRLPY